MSDGDALLRTILERPDDDVARLVYADWLQENVQESPEKCRMCCGMGVWSKYPEDDPANKRLNGPHWYTCYRCGGKGAVVVDRAEFIRVQVEIAKLRELHREGRESPADSARQQELFDRENALGEGVYPRHIHPVFAWLHARGIDSSACVFNRGGFLAELSCPLAAFMEHAEALFRAHPIERVALTDKSPWENATNPATHFGWWCENELMDRKTEIDVLPLPLMLCMDSDTRRQDRVIASRFDGDRMHGVILFEGRDTARDALSRACVAYGRSLAGLAPLPN